MKVMFRIRLFLWAAWVRGCKAMEKRKYNKIFESDAAGGEEMKKNKKNKGQLQFSKRNL